MIGPSQKERAALNYVAAMAGEILETNGPDISTWTVEQYHSFITAIVANYLDRRPREINPITNLPF